MTPGTGFQYHLSSQQIQSYRDYGFLVLTGALKGEKLAQLTQECMQAWHREKGAFDSKASWLKNSLLPDIHSHSASVLRYYLEGPLVDVAEQLIGPNIKGASSQLTFKMRGNTMPFEWHQDNGYGQLAPATALSTLTALDSTDEENGCLWVIPGSHHQGQIDVSDRLTAETKAAGIEVSIEPPNPEEAIPIRLQAGDALAFHCHLIHRSKGNASPTRDRRILFLRYADADAVEVYNQDRPRPGPLLRGATKFPEAVIPYER